MSPRHKLLMVVNVDWFFLSHRLPVAIAALDNGYEVHIATTLTKEKVSLSSYGFIVHPINIDRSGSDILRMAINMLKLYQLFWTVRPDILHLVTIQPVLLGGICSLFSPVRNVVYAISGLGHIFLSQGRFATLRQKLVGFVYMLALAKRRKRVIFQNPDDCELISTLAHLNKGDSMIIPGSGVDTNVLRRVPLSTGVPIVLMASRLLISKGVREFVGAARLLKKRKINARFQLVGGRDDKNPSCISKHELYLWSEQDVVEILGFRKDLGLLMENSHVIALPSYYPEGLPKVLCEASACGRAIVTCDTPGCRDAIENGVTGLLVPPRNSIALADTIQQMLEDPECLSKMGKAGRKRAEELYDVNVVICKHLEAYADLLSKR